jgi:hypothetical protein
MFWPYRPIVLKNRFLSAKDSSSFRRHTDNEQDTSQKGTLIMPRDPLPPHPDPVKRVITKDLFRQFFQQLEQQHPEIAAATVGRLYVPAPLGPGTLVLTPQQQALFALLGYAYALGCDGELPPDDAASPLGIVAGGVQAFALARIPGDELLLAAIQALQEAGALPVLPQAS